MVLVFERILKLLFFLFDTIKILEKTFQKTLVGIHGFKVGERVVNKVVSMKTLSELLMDLQKNTRSDTRSFTNSLPTSQNKKHDISEKFDFSEVFQFTISNFPCSMECLPLAFSEDYRTGKRIYVFIGVEI